MKEEDKEETEHWLQEFMTLYEQAETLILKIAKVDADGMPTDLRTLMEGSEKLPPILKSVKEISKPKEKELRKLKKEFQDILDACIKASEWGVKLAQDPNRVRFANIVFWTTSASGLMESFSKRLTSLPPE